MRLKHLHSVRQLLSGSWSWSLGCPHSFYSGIFMLSAHFALVGPGSVYFLTRVKYIQNQIISQWVRHRDRNALFLLSFKTKLNMLESLSKALQT